MTEVYLVTVGVIAGAVVGIAAGLWFALAIISWRDR